MGGSICQILFLGVCLCFSVCAVCGSYLFMILFFPSHLLALLVQALLNEVGAYLKLKTLWGLFVPTLIDFGRTAKNQVILMAIEWIDGIQLGKGKLALETSKCLSFSLSLILRVSYRLNMMLPCHES